MNNIYNIAISYYLSIYLSVCLSDMIFHSLLWTAFIAVSACARILRDKTEVYSASIDIPNVVVFASTIRTSQYFNDHQSVRNGVLSYRLFRNHFFSDRDLVVAVVVDSPISKTQKLQLLSDLRTYEIQFTLFPVVHSNEMSGEVDLLPDYVYSLKAFKSIHWNSNSHVLHISSASLFLKDPTHILLEHLQSVEYMSNIWCINDGSSVDVPSFKQFVSQTAPSHEVLSYMKNFDNEKRIALQCSPHILLISGMRTVQSLIDLVDHITSAIYFHSVYLPGVFEEGSAPAERFHAFERALHDSMMLKRALIDLTLTGIGGNVVTLGMLPSFAGIDLSVIPRDEIKSINSSSLTEHLYILLSPRLPHSKERALLRCYRTSTGECDVDVSEWEQFVKDPKYTQIAAAAARAIMAKSHACEVFSNSLSVVSVTDFLEIGSQSVSLVAKPHHSGNYVNTLNDKGARVTFEAAFQALSIARQQKTISFLHIGFSEETIVSLDRANNWVNEFLSYYESIPNSQRHLADTKLPCLVWIDNEQVSSRGGYREGDDETCNTLMQRYGARFYKLGYLPITDLCTSYSVFFFISILSICGC